ncbi:MAG: ABC transporter ATP-binding protein [Alphaproteobacteria bacterium]|nr:ABC transporter ATP-binding protein [Alphaproteobacteria bacterium]
MTRIEFPRHPWRFLLYFYHTLTVWQKTSIFLAVATTGFEAMASMVMLYTFKFLVDALALADPQNIWVNLKTPFWTVVGLCFLTTTILRIRGIVNAYSTPYILNALREVLVKNLTRHSHEYFHNRFSGDMVNKVNNMCKAYVDIFWDRLAHGFVPAFFSITSSCVLLGFVDPYLSLILLGVVGALFCASYFLGPKLSEASANLADRESDISGQLVDTITNISSVKNHAGMFHEIDLLKKIQYPYILAYRRKSWNEIIFWGVFDLIVSSLVIGLIWYLIENWASGKYSTGDVTVCMLIAWDAWWRLAGLSWSLTQLSGDLGRMQSALNDFVQPVGVEDKEGARKFSPESGEIEFKNISFVYDSGHQVFSDFNLTIPKAQKIGLVGLSGAGKTTLCQLLLRNYNLKSGEIIIGGQNIAEVTQDSLRQKIAVIPQDPSLFHRSLRENILYGRPEASEEEVIAAAKAAQAHDFILATQSGYDTMVGERGVKLSGGQRQRIAIARAILKDAPFLILDEATSSLDSDTERLIQSALVAAMEGRTTIVIAHRLSTLARMDRLVVLREGVIIEDGTLDQLVARGGHFAYLWNLQAGGFLPKKIEG